MIEYEGLPLDTERVPKYKRMTVDQFIYLTEIYLQHQYFKDVVNIWKILHECSSDHPLSTRDISDIFDTIVNIPCKSGYERPERCVERSVPYYYVDIEDDRIKELIKKFKKPNEPEDIQEKTESKPETKKKKWWRRKKVR